MNFRTMWGCSTCDSEYYTVETWTGSMKQRYEHQMTVMGPDEELWMAPEKDGWELAGVEYVGAEERYYWKRPLQ